MNPIQNALASMISSGSAQSVAAAQAGRAPAVEARPKPSSPGQERVTISDAARRLQAGLAAADPNRAERLGQLRALVVAGQYPADPKAIAQGLLRDSREVLAAVRPVA